MIKSLQSIGVIILLLCVSACATFEAQYKTGMKEGDFPEEKKLKHTFYLIGDAGNSPLGETSKALKAFEKELKNASKLVIHPGQGCLFTHEGKIEDVFTEEGLYELKTSNKPFITTITKVLNAFESEHKVGLWFYKATDIVNIRWGTRIPIKYNDPVYGFPVHLRAYGNYSIKITKPKQFFTIINSI